MISRLQYITQEIPAKGWSASGGKEFSHSELAEFACSGGVDWVQLRIKNKSYNEALAIAVKVESVCRKYHAKLIVNDNVTLAKAIRADGVHLGKTDIDPVEARNILGNKIIIGGTANTFEDIQKLVKANVDYIGLGPFRFTSTKENLSPIIGLEGYVEIMKKCNAAGIKTPIIAIGGIKIEDVRSLIDAGVYGIAVSSAITSSEHKTEMVKRFLNKIKFSVDSSLRSE